MKPRLDPNLRIVNSKYYSKYYVYSLKYSARESFCWKHNLHIPVILQQDLWSMVAHNTGPLQTGCTTYNHTQ